MAKEKYLRSCIVCKERNNKKNLLRFTLYNNELIPDYYQKMQGRGVYSCKNSKCINELNENLIRKNLKKDVSFKFDKVYIKDIIIENLEKDIFNILTIANKSGKLVATLNKFIQYAENIDFKMVFLAYDISENSLKKIKKYLTNSMVIKIFNKESLGKVFNKSEINVIAVKDSKFINILSDKISFLINLTGVKTYGYGKSS